MTMAQRIKEERLKANLTQEELANKLGLQKAAVSKFEKGRVTNIKRSTIEKMASIFGCKPSYLLGFEEENPTDTLAKQFRIIEQTIRDYSKKELPEDAQSVAERYMTLDEFGKRMVESVLDMEIERKNRYTKPVLMAAHNDKEHDETAEMLTDAERIDKLD